MPIKKPEISETIDEMTERFVIAALRQSKGNRIKAGKLLGITERTVYSKIIKYNIQKSTYAK